MGLGALAYGIGTGAMTGGLIYSGMAASAEAKSAENMANYNAAVLEQQAKATEQRTALAQRQEAERGARIQSTLESRLAASGAVTTTGAPLLLQAKQASETELKNLMIGYEGETEASRIRSEAGIERMRGKIARKRGRAESIGRYAEAGGTLLTGFATGKERGYW
jgi:hypothetical protein